MADPIPATQDKIIPHWAKPRVWRRKPKAIKLAKKSSETFCLASRRVRRGAVLPQPAGASGGAAVVNS